MYVTMSVNCPRLHIAQTSSFAKCGFYPLSVLIENGILIHHGTTLCNHKKTPRNYPEMFQLRKKTKDIICDFQLICCKVSVLSH